MLMGEQLDPQQPAMPLNLPQARKSSISCPCWKKPEATSPDEQVVMKDMLYALRMKFVSLTAGKPSIHPVTCECFLRAPSCACPLPGSPLPCALPVSPSFLKRDQSVLCRF